MPNFTIHTQKQTNRESGTDDETRTRTTIAGQRVLSPLRLPFRHIGKL